MPAALGANVTGYRPGTPLDEVPELTGLAEIFTGAPGPASPDTAVAAVQAAAGGFRASLAG